MFDQRETRGVSTGAFHADNRQPTNFSLRGSGSCILVKRPVAAVHACRMPAPDWGAGQNKFSRDMVTDWWVEQGSQAAEGKNVRIKAIPSDCRALRIIGATRSP